MATTVSAKDSPAVVTISETGAPGDKGETGENGTGLNNVRKSLLDNPLLHILKTNQLTDVIAPTSMDSDLTWTRATTATYIDRYGAVQTAAINEPRQEAEGWLIEGASTNATLRSEEFDLAAWTKAGTLTVTPNTIAAPDGQVTADTITCTDVNIENLLMQATSFVDSGQTITMSYFVKGGTVNEINLRTLTLSGGVVQDYASRFNTSTGVFSSVSPNHKVSVIALSGGWFRIAATITANNTGNTQYQTRCGLNQQGFAYIWGAQTEESGLSSYIPTSTSSVTRSSDNLSCIVLNNLPSKTDDTSIVFSVKSKHLSGFHNFISVDLSAIDTLRVTHTSESTIAFKHGSASSTAITDYNGGKTSLAMVFGYSDNLLTVYQDGVEKSQVDAGIQYDVIPSNIISFGSRQENGSRFMYGHLSDIRIYDFALNASEVNFLNGD